MSIVDRTAATPLYYQLREELRRRITSGEWEEAEPLPSEMELCATHSVSRSVVRQALGELAHEGLLERRQGLGTFVSKPKIEEALAEKEVGFFEDMTSKGYEVRTTVLRLETEKPSLEVATDLELSPRERVIVLCRVRHVDGVPLVYVESRLSASRFSALLEEDFERNSLYDVLNSRFGIQVAGSRRLIGAVTARKRIAELLEIRPGSPLVVLDSVSLGSDGRPLEVYLAYHRGDRTKFEVQTKADGRMLSQLHVVEGE
jgi:GntR family transcriptional regulator